MRDHEGRDIRYLRLSVTDRCNCRCRYCMPAGGVPMLSHDDVCSLEELAQIARACARLGVTKVRLTGGEPLVRRGVCDLVRMVAEVPGVEEVAMTTNATLLAPVAGELAAAGLTRVNVSLDSLDPATYASLTRGASLGDALAGLDAACAAGFTRVKVNCVLLGGLNDAEVPEIAALARDRDVDVRFIELMPIGEAARWGGARPVPAERVLDALPEGAAPVGRDGVAELWGVPGWRGRVGLIRPMSHRFCSQCDRIRVTADGRLKPCLHSREEIALRGLSDAELEDAIRAGIAAKPAHHLMDGAHASSSARDMNEIGG